MKAWLHDTTDSGGADLAVDAEVRPGPGPGAGQQRGVAAQVLCELLQVVDLVALHQRHQVRRPAELNQPRLAGQSCTRYDLSSTITDTVMFLISVRGNKTSTNDCLGVYCVSLLLEST